MRRIVRTAFLIVAAGAVTRSSAADELLTARIEAAIARFDAQNHVPGASWALVTPTQNLAGATGLVNLETGVAATPQFMFRIGSISKVFTSTLVLQLADEALLDLDAPIQKYCAAFPQKQWPVTARELLAHLGGIRNYRGAAEFFDTRSFDSVTKSVSIVADDPLQQEPNTKFAYTTYGYNLLGCAVEAVTSRTFFEALRTRILSPLKIESVRPDSNSEIISGRASGYSRLESGATINSPHVDLSGKLPGGGLVARAADVATLASALLGGKILKPVSLTAAWTEQKTVDETAVPYGLGWRLATTAGLREVYHGGEACGFSSFLYVQPERKLVFVYLGNLDRLGDQRLKLAREVATIAASEDATK